MKNLEKEQLETLLDIIGSSSTPSLQIAHFSEGGEVLIDKIYAYCLNKKYEYHLKCTNKEFYELTAQKFKEQERIVVSNFFLQRRSYLIQAREYNFLFVTTIIDEESRGDFLKRSHKIIRSAGSIIIFVPKKDYHDRDNWVSNLEENLYVSTSVVDDMFEHYDVIISRKMHGWGD
jgi:hypothetical protein